MRRLASLLALAAQLYSIPASAQDVPPSCVPGPYQPGLGAPWACPLASDVDGKRQLEQVLLSDPQYLEARSRRNGGIVLTSVGAGVGLVAIAVAWATYVVRNVGTVFCTSCHNDYAAEKVVAISGAGLLVVSVAVGVPMIVSGAREMRWVRQRYVPVPWPSVSVGPGQVALSGTWRF